MMLAQAWIVAPYQFFYLLGLSTSLDAEPSAVATVMGAACDEQQVNQSGCQKDPNHPNSQESKMRNAMMNVGNSGAFRLQLQSVDNAINNIFSKYRSIQGKGKLIENSIVSDRPLFLQKLSLNILTSALLISPLVLKLFLGDNKNDFMKEMILLLYMYGITTNAVEKGMALLNYAPAVSTFGKQLVSITSNELQPSTKRHTGNNKLHLPSTASSSKGISVSDLWVSHAAKR